MNRPLYVGEKSCDICYEENLLTIKCFWNCSLCVCRNCIKKMLGISTTGYIYIQCPQCRRYSYNKKTFIFDPNDQQLADTRFGFLCENINRISRRIFDLYQRFYEELGESKYEEEILLIPNSI